MIAEDLSGIYRRDELAMRVIALEEQVKKIQEESEELKTILKHFSFSHDVKEVNAL